MKVTADTISDEQIRELRDSARAYGDGDPEFVVRICIRALTTAETITDDQIEAFVRRKMEEEPERRIHWLGMGDEAMADPRVGAPYKAYCRSEIAKAYRAQARARCAEILNARSKEAP